MKKLNYVLEFYLQLDKEEPDEEKTKAILTEKLKAIINDPSFDPLDYMVALMIRQGKLLPNP